MKIARARENEREITYISRCRVQIQIDEMYINSGHGRRGGGGGDGSHMKFDNDDVRRVAGGQFRLLSSFNNMSSYRSFLLQS